MTAHAADATTTEPSPTIQVLVSVSAVVAIVCRDRAITVTRTGIQTL